MPAVSGGQAVRQEEGASRRNLHAIDLLATVRLLNRDNSPPRAVPSTPRILNPLPMLGDQEKVVRERPFDERNPVQRSRLVAVPGAPLDLDRVRTDPEDCGERSDELQVLALGRVEGGVSLLAHAAISGEVSREPAKQEGAALVDARQLLPGGGERVRADEVAFRVLREADGREELQHGGVLLAADVDTRPVGVVRGPVPKQESRLHPNGGQVRKDALATELLGHRISGTQVVCRHELDGALAAAGHEPAVTRRGVDNLRLVAGPEGDAAQL